MPLRHNNLTRSHSANSVKVTQVKDGGPGGQWSTSTPELRSMLINLSTTVPYNISSPNIPSACAKKQLRHRHRKLCFTSSFSTMERCFGVRLCLVILQILLGAAIVALSTYIHLYVTAIRFRERPFWAGILLCLSGLLGICFCIRNKKRHEETPALVFGLKVVSLVLAVGAILTCVTSAVFTCIHLVRLFTYEYCRHLSDACRCYFSQDEDSKSYLYSPVGDCNEVYCHIKICIMFTGGLCLLGSIVALTFLIILWRSRYGQIYARTTREAVLS